MTSIKLLINLLILPGFLAIATQSGAQDSTSHVRDSLIFKGQLSAWGFYSRQAELPVMAGGRYIPTLNYGFYFPRNRLIDMEASVNIWGTAAFRPFDSARYTGDISAYRAWVRYSSRHWELRLGLQKISFGSATLLRPLMWFDQIDPRDPLQLTNGVWGLLSRYYFPDNANLWLWCLYGNKQARPWDIGKTNQWIPEAGGRFQHPIPKGEIALTYHYRDVDTRALSPTIPVYEKVPENRIGLDAKIDLAVGLWLEGTWIHKGMNSGIYTNQEIFCAGADYTFGIGNGLYVLCEQFLYSSDEEAFSFTDAISYTGISFSYPVGIADNLSAIIYYDWTSHNSYNFVNWNHNFRHLAFYLMAYWNPEQFNLPQNGNISNTFAGPGLQVMLVYDH
jgi:hypothetical protein